MRNQELVFAMRLAIPCNMAGISFYSITCSFLLCHESENEPTKIKALPQIILPAL
jgi:hypothetical protein